jgi:hypothetical protein
LHFSFFIAYPTRDSIHHRNAANLALFSPLDDAVVGVLPSSDFERPGEPFHLRRILHPDR